MDNLLKEYQQSLKDLRKIKEIAEEYDQKIYAGMITDLEFAINWMQTGRPPGRTSGVYGSSPSAAMFLEPEKLDALSYKKGFPVPLNPFEEAEIRIDKERAVKKRA